MTLLRPAFVLLALTLAVTSLFAQDANLKQALDPVIAKAIKNFQVPGISVAVVKEGQVIYRGNFGERNAETGDKMKPEALFNIASLSKAFTAAGIAMLVEEGKLSWDDKIIDHIPEFQVADPWVTKELNLRDMLSHRTGFDTFYGDLLWYETSYTDAEIIERMRYVPMTNDFGREFGYQNNFFIVAGEIIKRTTGQTWAEFMKARIFDPLQMNETRACSKMLGNNQTLAHPHIKTEKIEIPQFDPNAAASIWSSTEELTNWMKMWLDTGKFNGTQVLPKAAVQQCFTQHTAIPVGGYSASMGTNFFGYGLGWFLWDYEGKKVVEHSGGMPGFISRLTLVPQEKLGIVILTNDMSSLPSALRYQILQLVVKGTSERDFVGEFLKFKIDGDAAETDAEAKRLGQRQKDTKPTTQIPAYVGKYTDKMYGDATVDFDNGRFSLTLEPAKTLFTGELTHWHYDTWRWETQDAMLPPGYVTFNFDSYGKVSGFKIDLPNPDFHFFNLDFKKVDE